MQQEEPVVYIHPQKGSYDIEDAVVICPAKICHNQQLFSNSKEVSLALVIDKIVVWNSDQISESVHPYNQKEGDIHKEHKAAW